MKTKIRYRSYSSVAERSGWSSDDWLSTDATQKQLLNVKLWGSAGQESPSDALASSAFFIPLEWSRWPLFFWRNVKSRNFKKEYLDSLIRVHNDGDEQGQNGVNKEADERVKVKLGEERRSSWLEHSECCKHVIAIEQREESLRSYNQSSELWIERAEHQPAANDVAKVKRQRASKKLKNFWHRVRES